MKQQARVVVIGGGIVGVSILYHLARSGWTDVALCERTELTAGSTWHAAGLLPLYHPSYSIGRINKYSVDFYQTLEAETGQAVSFHKTGNLRIASSKDRMDEYNAYCDTANTSGVPFEIISPDRVKQLWPFMNTDGILGALHHPHDGHIAPADVTQAMAAGARNYGAEIYRHTEVTAIQQRASGDWQVDTSQGSIIAEHVVCATGFYARQTAKLVGLDLPCIPVLHQFLVTDSIDELQSRKEQGYPELPVLREDRSLFYLREERQGFILGPYDSNPPVWAENAVPEGFGQELLDPDMDRMIDQFEAASKVVPLLENAGIREIVNGPIAHTPDGSPLVGPAWGLPNFWLAEGNTFGILLAGGVGKYLSEWIIEGEPSIDMFEVDPRRFGAYADQDYTIKKNIETYGHVFEIHYPNLEMPAARPLKTSPCYSRMCEAGAVWGQKYGWERANWFATEGVEARDILSFRRTNDFAAIASECHAARNKVALIDFTPFTKFEITGKGAYGFLDGLLANRLPAVGKLRLAHVLTGNAGIRSEFTVTCLNKEHFYVVTPAWAERYDEDLLLKSNADDDSVRIRNITSDKGAFVITGPNSRDLLALLTTQDLSQSEFPWFSARTVEITGIGQMLAIRVSYIGELGWELHHDIEQQLALYDLLFEKGKTHGLKPIGMRAIDSLRLEKSYRGWNLDLSSEYSPFESGLERFIAIDKGEFLGRDALLKQQSRGIDVKMVTLEIDHCDVQPISNAPVFDASGMVGRITSGGYGHTLKKVIALGYIDIDVLNSTEELEAEILGERY
ncbi:MAG: FAD-dependent oxidoreductase, partial [Gammaproteobacteria bacterium]|nr:FAD-dependent oxidoreductase [Gammaproteobacteria bacterium]